MVQLRQGTKRGLLVEEVVGFTWCGLTGSSGPGLYTTIAASPRMGM